MGVLGFELRLPCYKLCLYSPSVPSWHVIGWYLPCIGWQTSKWVEYDQLDVDFTGCHYMALRKPGVSAEPVIRADRFYKHVCSITICTVTRPDMKCMSSVAVGTHRRSSIFVVLLAEIRSWNLHSTEECSWVRLRPIAVFMPSKF
jgi:hypothetical protein